MKHVDMRKLPAAAQEERRRQVIGLRQAGMTYDAIGAQVGLTARLKSHAAGRRLRLGWTMRCNMRRIMARVTMASETSGSAS